MSMTEAQMRDAYQEAQHILRLDKKWQHLMPGERKPNFRRVAREIIRRALGHKVRQDQAPLDMHGGLMHEHNPREAALIERTLKNGMYDPSVLHSFQRGTDEIPERPYAPDFEIEDPSLPDYEVFVHSHATTIDYPSHYEPGTDTYHSSVHDPPEHAEVPMKVPAATRLPSDYEAVH
jgi:hypothetical protein